MADDEPWDAHLFGDPGDGEPVEAVAAHAPARAIRGTAYVAASAGIDAWKAVSKTATLGTFGNDALRLLDRGERGWVLERRESGQLRDRTQDLVVDLDRIAEALAAVDDPVADAGELGSHGGVEIGEHLGRLVLMDEVELQARRAGVDDENVAHLTDTTLPG